MGFIIKKKLSIKCDRESYVSTVVMVDFEIGGYDVCRIYIGRGSKVKSNAKGNSILYIDNYNSDVEIVKGEDAFVKEWIHIKE